jgi:hypothetical protein
VLNKESKLQIQIDLAIKDKDYVDLAHVYRVSSTLIKDAVERVLFKITLCYAGENHIFYRNARTRKQALGQAKRGLEKKLGYERGRLGAHFHLDFHSIVRVVPCVCYTCKHSKDKLCLITADYSSAMGYCNKWEEHRGH